MARPPRSKAQDVWDLRGAIAIMMEAGGSERSSWTALKVFLVAPLWLVTMCLTIAPFWDYYACSRPPLFTARVIDAVILSDIINIGLAPWKNERSSPSRSLIRSGSRPRFAPALVWFRLEATAG